MLELGDTVIGAIADLMSAFPNDWYASNQANLFKTAIIEKL